MDTEPVRKWRNEGLKRRNKWKNLKQKIKTTQYVQNNEDARIEEVQIELEENTESNHTRRNDKLQNPLSSNPLKFNIDSPIRSKITPISNNNKSATVTSANATATVTSNMSSSLTRSIENLSNVQVEDCQYKLPLFSPPVRRKIPTPQ